jgi:hypothetical protein
MLNVRQHGRLELLSWLLSEGIIYCYVICGVCKYSIYEGGHFSPGTASRFNDHRRLRVERIKNECIFAWLKSPDFGC